MGARWDAIQKKWHAPADKDITLFARWQMEPGAVTSPGIAIPSSKSSSPPKKTSSADVKTRAQDKDFIAYSGELPPWN
ncbi:MAG: DUF5710 domain-containing protein [Methylobacter sp.]|nr:DUF5710 domain-containing protein [Methylobacter sp.]